MVNENAQAQWVLQYDIAGHAGTQTLQTKRLAGDGDRWLQQKDGEIEFYYFDAARCYRGLDTSPGEWEGVGKVWYEQRTGTKRGAYWGKRELAVGDVWYRSPLVRWKRFDNCGHLQDSSVTDELRVKAVHESFTFREGYRPDGRVLFVLEAPVLELEWVVGGAVIETYYYSGGLVGWRNNEGWWSALCEYYDDRGPMDPPSLSDCLAAELAQCTVPNLYYYQEVPPPPPPPPPVQWTPGIDVSSWQGLIDFRKVKEHGVEFAFIRFTGGGTFVDTHYKRNWEGFWEVDIPAGPYHFIVPTWSPVVQANHLLNHFNYEMLTQARLPVMLDAERADGMSPSVCTINILQVASLIAAATGVVPVMYTGAWWWDPCTLRGTGAIFDLSVASYRAGSPILPIDWKPDRWLFWQYTSSGVVPGIVGPVDLQWFRGDRDDFRAYSGLLDWKRQACRGAPPFQYERTFVLLPQDVHPTTWVDTARWAYPRRHTIGFSFEDAGIGDLDVRRVVATAFPHARHEEVLDYFRDNYPGVQVFFMDKPPGVD